MANPGRLTNPEQTSLPLTLSESQTSADDMLRDEIYSARDGRPLTAKQIKGRWNDVLDRLQTASDFASKSDLKKADDVYALALRAAESIDQVSVTRERRLIREALQDRTLDRITKRKLLQLDSDLEAVQNAPSIVLANWGLEKIRKGDKATGTKMLLAAQERYPDMKDDANFKRHLKDVVAAAESTSTSTSSTRISADLPPVPGKPVTELPKGFPQPTIQTEPTPPGDYRPPVQPVPPGGRPLPADVPVPPQTVPQPGGRPSPYDAPVPPQVVTPPGVGPLPSDAPVPPQVVTPPGVRPLPSDVPPPPVVAQPGAPSTTRPGDPARPAPAEATQPRIAPLDAQRRTPIDSAAALYAQVVSENRMTDATQKQFLQAIANADAGVSPKLLPYLLQFEQTKEPVVKLFQADPQLLAKIDAHDKAIQTIFNKLPEREKALATQLFIQMDMTSNAEDRLKVKQQLAQIDPQMQRLLDGRDVQMGPALISGLQKVAQAQDALEKQMQTKEAQAELNQAAITRFTFALALEKAGKLDDAKKYLVDALVMNKSTDAGMNDFWRKTAARMGVPIPGDVVPGGPAPGDAPPPPPTGSAAELVFNVNERFKAAADRGNAAEAFKQLTPEFLKSISKADEEFSKAVTKIPEIQKLNAELEKMLTGDRRQQALKFISALNAEKDKMSPADNDKAERYQDPKLPAAEKAVLRQHFTQIAPNFVKVNDEFETFAGKEILEKLDGVKKGEYELNAALTGRFLSRLYMAQAADRAGDSAQTSALFYQALSAVPKEIQASFLRSSPDVQTIADKVGLKPEQVPLPPDELLKKAQPQTAADKAEKRPMPALGPENEGLRPDQMLQQAKLMLHEQGMTPATKKQFEECLKVADSLFTEKDVKDIQKLQQWLKTGKKDNGDAVTPLERVQMHKEICNAFLASSVGIQWRAQYAQLLVENKQDASAQRVYLECIQLADKLPLGVFREQMELLSKDMSSRDITREHQVDLHGLFSQIGGTTASGDDGLLYMPISCRKTAIYFYMSGEGKEPNGPGIFKPDDAILMVNNIREARLRLYGVDLNKNPKADPSLLELAKKLEPLASESLRKEKMKADTFWTNALIDVGIGAAALSTAGFLAGLATKNPRLCALALNGEKTALNLGGKAVVAGVTFTGAMAGRSFLHKTMTGHDESLETTFYHTAAGVGAFAAVVASRGAINRTLFAGATEQGAILRFANTKAALTPVAEGAVAGEAVAAKNLTAQEWGNALAANNIRVPQKTLTWIAENPKALVVSEGAINQAVFNEIKLGLNSAQAANLAGTVAPKAMSVEAAAGGTAAKGPSWYSTSALDLTTATTGQLRTRAALGNWAQATAGVGAFDTISALDRPINPETGEKIGVWESMGRANWRSPYDNTLTKGVWTAIAFRNGALPRNYYEKGASLYGRVKGYATAPFQASKWGATTAGASYSELGKQAGYMVFANHMYDFSVAFRTVEGYGEAAKLKEKIAQTQIPILDHTPPGAVPLELPTVTPATPDGKAPPVPPAETTGAPLQDAPPPKPEAPVVPPVPPAPVGPIKPGAPAPGAPAKPLDLTIGAPPGKL